MALFGVLATPAFADHPGAAGELTPAVERVLGNDASEANEGLFRIELNDGAVLRTHGPDLEPDETELPNAIEAAGPSDRFLAGGAERAPVCASDYAMQVLYARSPSSADNHAASTASIQSVVRRSNFVLNEDAIASGGGGADYKVVCDGQGAVDVESFTTPGTTFSGVVNAAKAAGFGDVRRNYAIFLDEPAPGGYCGVGSLYLADSPGLTNPHNTNGGYAVIYKSCWQGTTFMHEVGHNRGAVQASAPTSTGSGSHCNDGRDVMCYAPDGGDRNQSMTYPCSSLTRFDCNFDTYFDAAPEPGEYLATHWNLGRQGQNFLTILPPGPDSPPADTVAPQTQITLAPALRSRKRARFEFTGADKTSAPAALAFECSLDAAAFAPCASPAAYRLRAGRHSLAVRAMDEAGNVDASPAVHTWKVRRNRR